MNFVRMGLIVVGLAAALVTPSRGAEPDELLTRVRGLEESLGQVNSILSRKLDEMRWSQQLSEVALVDQVHFTGPPPRTTNNPAPPVGSNDVVISAMTFVPREKGRAKPKSRPLIVLVHGEIHGNAASDEEAHVVRELIGQGYAVILPDYRGSSGYGTDFWRLIDYGGLEVEDVDAARRWMIESHREIDPARIGIIGWSHGGLIALLTVFAHPADYAACYAGVPVSDLEERIRIRGKDYEQLFAAPYHLGKTLAEAPEEYRRRSPAWNAAKLRTPLLVQANTNDSDVTVREVQKLIDALNAAGRSFEHRIYTNAPGGHMFNRIDTPLALESRAEIWRFLGRYLHPPRATK